MFPNTKLQLTPLHKRYTMFLIFYLIKSEVHQLRHYEKNNVKLFRTDCARNFELCAEEENFKTLSTLKRNQEEFF